MQSRKDRAGFTLIEILVVITIIVILSSLFFPVVKSAREAGNAAKCLSNLRQIVNCLNLYASEHNGFIPSGRAAPNTSVDTWYSRLTPYADPDKSTDKAVSAMSATEQKSYNEIWRKLSCPSLDRKSRAQIPAALFQQVWPTYGINLSVRGYNGGYGLQNWNNGLTRNLRAITKPSQTLAFIDTDGYEYTYEDAYQRMTEAEWKTLMPARHKGCYNGVFLDGHTETIPLKRLQDATDPMWKAIW